MPHQYFDVAGFAVNVLHAGRSTLPGAPPDLSRGRTLVFLHGAGSTAAIWRRQLEHFAAHHSPVAIDWPGHGRSSGTEAMASVEAYADTTLALLDTIGAGAAVIVGTSMGGLVALDLALRAPARVAALVLLSTAAHMSLPAEMIESWRQVTIGRASQPFTPFGYGDEVPFEVMREGWELQVRTDPRVRYFDMLAAERADYRSRLGEIRAPTLVAHGAKDPICTPAESAELAAGIRGAVRVEIAAGGHFLYRERPAELHAAIDGFLEKRS